jgi:hypothetical protein
LLAVRASVGARLRLAITGHANSRDASNRARKPFRVRVREAGTVQAQLAGRAFIRAAVHHTDAVAAKAVEIRLIRIRAERAILCRVRNAVAARADLTDRAGDGSRGATGGRIADVDCTKISILAVDAGSTEGEVADPVYTVRSLGTTGTVGTAWLPSIRADAAAFQ